MGGSRVPATQLRGRHVAYPLTAALPDDVGDIIQQKSDIVKQGGMLSGFFSAGTPAKIGSVFLVGLDTVGGVLFLANAPSWVQGKSLWRNLYDVTCETFDTTFKEFISARNSASGNIAEQIASGIVTVIVLVPVGAVLAAFVSACAAIAAILQESIIAAILVGLVFGATYFFGGDPAVANLLVGFRWVCRFSLAVNAAQYTQLYLENREDAPKVETLVDSTPTYDVVAGRPAKLRKELSNQEREVEDPCSGDNYTSEVERKDAEL